MIEVKRFVLMAMKGNEPKTTSEKLQPLIIANANPETVIQRAMTIVPIFSPIA